MLTDQIAELSPSAQKAVQVYVSSLHMMESLLTPGKSDAVNNHPDPRRMPGNLEAARTLREIVASSEEARRVRRNAHKHLIGIAYRSRSQADRTAKRITGDIPPRDGCTVVEGGQMCGRPVHGKGMCVKHYRRQQRAGTRNKRHTAA